MERLETEQVDLKKQVTQVEHVGCSGNWCGKLKDEIHIEVMCQK